MQVNYVEFEKSFHKYFDYAKKGEIIIVQDGEPVIKLIPAAAAKRKAPAKKLIGAFGKCRDMDLRAIREERLRKYENID